MKTTKMMLVLVCVLIGAVLTGCSSCHLTCCRHHMCNNTCTSAVTHADYTASQQR
jgi:hypothetical protein